MFIANAFTVYSSVRAGMQQASQAQQNHLMSAGVYKTTVEPFINQHSIDPKQQGFGGIITHASLPAIWRQIEGLNGRSNSSEHCQKESQGVERTGPACS